MSTRKRTVPTMTIEDALKFLEEGLSTAEIGEKFGKGTSWVRVQFEMHGITDFKLLNKRDSFKKRDCLCCRVPFLSEGNHNRLCFRCRTQSEDSGYRIIPR